MCSLAWATCLNFQFIIFIFFFFNDTATTEIYTLSLHDALPISDEFNIDYKLLEENNIHIHFPEGAVSKDGPSAGIAITSALISIFKKQTVKYSISMTGEITLRGRILPIGGLKEKIIGAHRAGIKMVFLPKENEKDLEEIPADIKKDITFNFASNYIEIYKKLFK